MREPDIQVIELEDGSFDIYLGEEEEKIFREAADAAGLPLDQFLIKGLKEFIDALVAEDKK